MSGGLIVLLCVAGLVMFGVWFALFLAVRFVVFVSIGCRKSFSDPSPLCIPKVLWDVVRRFDSNVLLVVPITADDVLWSVGGINVSTDTINDTLPYLFLVFWM